MRGREPSRGQTSSSSSSFTLTFDLELVPFSLFPFPFAPRSSSQILLSTLGWAAAVLYHCFILHDPLLKLLLASLLAFCCCCSHHEPGPCSPAPSTRSSNSSSPDCDRPCCLVLPTTVVLTGQYCGVSQQQPEDRFIILLIDSTGVSSSNSLLRYDSVPCRAAF